MFRRKCEVKQSDLTDCGPACLASVARWHRLRLSLSWIRRAVATGQLGTTIAGLIAGAQAIGLLAKGVKGPAEALPSVPLPAIAHGRLAGGGYHFVVLYAWRKNAARVMDPASGRMEKWSHQRFLTFWSGALVILTPGESFVPGDRTLSPARRLWQLLRPHRSVFVQALLGALVTTVLGLGTSLYVQQIVDSVIPDGNAALLNLLALAMAASAGIRLVVGVLQALLSLQTAQRIDATLVLGYYRHLFQLPQSFFDTMRIGEITSRVADAIKIRNFLNNTLPTLVLNPLILVFSFGTLLAWSPPLALVSGALLPANLVVYWIINRCNRTWQRRIMERSADLDAHLVESLGAQSLIRHFRLENSVGLRAETRLVRLLRATGKASLAAIAGGSATGFATSIYVIALLWLGARLVLQARLSTGELMSCYALSAYLTGPITTLIGLNSALQEAAIATDRLFEIMDLETSRDEGVADVELPPSGIDFERVTFRHAGRSPVLDEISFRIEPAAITALTGESGSGKSTLLALLQRLHTPESGRILLGSRDLRLCRLDSLRRAMACVPQQTHLLAGTVLENIAPGNDPPDFPRLLAACRRAGALEFIERLPRGFLTLLNENGLNLSGGQRQRLALARALYLDPPILLLDEPSSALDQEAEGDLAFLLQQLRAAGRTVIVAAHSARLIATADRVIHLAHGRARITDRQPDGIAASASTLPCQDNVAASPLTIS
ncbi:MAG TPA: peptidase domain-containing ABC transporter [Candidatus Didemnitutus sp.]|nr:peptidase domain-containing ABC transporter [Candidatus Didemnitutus sp.]